MAKFTNVGNRRSFQEGNLNQDFVRYYRNPPRKTLTYTGLTPYVCSKYMGGILQRGLFVASPASMTHPVPLLRFLIIHPNNFCQTLPSCCTIAKKDFVCKNNSLQKSLAAGSGVPRPGSLYPKAKQLVPICSYARIKKLDSCSSPTSSLFHAFRDFPGPLSPWPLLTRMPLKEEMHWPSG